MPSRARTIASRVLLHGRRVRQRRQQRRKPGDVVGLTIAEFFPGRSCTVSRYRRSSPHLTALKPGETIPWRTADIVRADEFAEMLGRSSGQDRLGGRSSE
jgi:hypothetical protein